MIEVIRIVEHQASLSSYRATQNEERAITLELVIESTKARDQYIEWHPLISTPFRYSPPHPEARFRPPYGKNVFYGSLAKETAFYEYAFHFMKQRVHLDIVSETGTRTIFSVDADDRFAFDLSQDRQIENIIDKDDYTASHQFIKNHPDISFILYPSCRDPESRNNAAILNIHHLKQNLKWESSIKFFYDNQKKEIKWF
ncbi:MAG TPA: RES family NAD+ phosphorylase [Gammaproteobacteria bacterium]|jgi:hypothetical protein|nr:RES family NAD+ phosphorylase [Gammaproteobacteria bacterium]